MLEATTQKTIAFQLAHFAIKVVETNTRNLVARYRNGNARKRKAAFLSGYLFALHLYNLRINKHKRIGGFVWAIVAINNHHALIKANLWRSKSAAIIGIHGIEHLLSELL